MEISERLKLLYKHWQKHTDIYTKRSNEVIYSSSIYEDITAFITERMLIFNKKEYGEEIPYTRDPILSIYRFCNIYRELDRQTIFFHTLLKPIESNFSLWLLNMLFCRSICNTETIKKIGLLSFDVKHNEQVYTKLLNLPSPKYGNAYVFPISVIQKSSWPTREKFFCYYYPTAIQEIAEYIESFENISVTSALRKILPVFGFNVKFLWTEVLIDVAYQFPTFIDLFKEFPCGPGSIPTMKLLNNKVTPEQTVLALTATSVKDFPYLTLNGKPIKLSAENWEGIGCEFRKYLNIRNGTGRKRRYY